MPKQDVRVKQSIRKGKLVRSYVRKQDKRNTALKAAIGAASVLGTSVATYLVLKKRYLNNLDNVAKNMKANPDIGKVIKDKENMLFTFGGFVAKGEKNQGEAIILNKTIKDYLGRDSSKKTEFIAMNHNWSTGKSKDYYEQGFKELRYLTSVPFPTLKSITIGRNDEAVIQAQNVYSWVEKNPGKKVKLIGISAGGQLVKDIEYILKKKGIDVETVTIGNFDNKMHNMSTSLNVINKNDTLVKATIPRKATYINVPKQEGFGGNHYLGSLIYKSKDSTKPLSKDNKEINSDLFNQITKYLKIN